MRHSRASCRTLHRGVRHPLEQSLRGGSQTERNLPRDNPVIAAFFAMLDAPIRDYIAGSAGRRHPSARLSQGQRLPDFGLVVRAASGRRLSHRPRTSARLVELRLLRDPAGCSDADTRAGWLKFGEAGNESRGLRARTFRQARSRDAGAVPVVHVARHRAIRRRRPAPHGRVRRGAGLTIYLATAVPEGCLTTDCLMSTSGSVPSL